MRHANAKMMLVWSWLGWLLAAVMAFLFTLFVGAQCFIGVRVRVRELG